MKKLAVFVEGLTEQEFVVRLLRELLGDDRIIIWMLRLNGGQMESVRQPPLWEGLPHFAWVVNCQGEGSVASAIRDRYHSLVAAEFGTIVGLRDVYPLDHADIPGLLADMNFGLPADPIRAEIVLAILEIESWFIAEHSHFQKVHPSLTPERIARGVRSGFNPETNDVELIPHPARLLGEIYALEGGAYRKGEHAARAVVSRLDYASLYADVAPRYPRSLGKLVAVLDRFATPED